jgi:hypothetical protein
MTSLKKLQRPSPAPLITLPGGAESVCAQANIQNV